MINFAIPGQPQGKARAKTVRNKHTGGVHSFTPEKTVLYENLIKTIAMEQKPKCTEKPVCLIITAYFEIPKSKSKKIQGQMLADEILPTKKPDLDNIVKCVKDALNGIVYKDDSQVVQLYATKYYAYTPRVEITITEVKG